MAVSLAVIRSRVRLRVHDSETRRESLGVMEYDNAIAEAYLSLSSRMPAPHLYTPNAFTIAANAETFTLPTAPTIQYGGDVRIQLISDASFMRKRTREEVDAFRNGETLPTGRGRPEIFALWEESDQDVQGICWPRSKDSEPCNLYATLINVDLRDAADLDAASILFSRYSAQALVYHVAAELVASMDADALKLRRLNPNVVTLWKQEADRMLYKDEARRSNVESLGHVMRWIS